MAVKISDLTAKGTAIAATDLLEIAEVDGAGYVSKSVTGQDIIDAVSGAFVPYTGATANVDLGAFNLEATTIVKTGGLATEFLMADGTTTTAITFLNPRVQTVASAATVTPTSANDIVTITAQAAALALANPTGAFVEGQSLIIRIKDNATARAITYGTDYRAIGVTLPTTTVLSKTTYLGIIYNSTDTKWDVVGVTTQA
jgi:hypothetical protein